MIELYFWHVVDLDVPLEGHGEVVEGLLVALVVEVGCTEVMVCLDEVKLSLAMGVDQDLTQKTITLDKANSCMRILTLSSSLASENKIL